MEMSTLPTTSLPPLPLPLLQVDADAMALLLEAGVDEELASHVAHLFVRDPLVIMTDKLHPSAGETDHFENLQSTNWQTVRWKPPPPRKSCAPPVGWRVEFRSMEVQLTDFENAAFTTFVVLVSRVILAFGLNLYIPLSKVDENMRRAHKRDAVSSSVAARARMHPRDPPPIPYHNLPYPTIPLPLFTPTQPYQALPLPCPVLTCPALPYPSLSILFRPFPIPSKPTRLDATI